MPKPRFAQAPTIRPARISEAAFIGELARSTLSTFGDYGRLLPDWMREPGIRTYIAEAGGQSTGAVMLGFFDDEERGKYADLLAIAVAPAFQRRGIGRALLRFAIDESRKSHEPLRELRLSVADTNAHARSLFIEAGFVFCPYELGTYDGGQVALRMALPLRDDDSRAA